MSAVLKRRRDHMKARRERLCPDGWLTTADAADFLSVAECELHQQHFKAIEHKPVYIESADELMCMTRLSELPEDKPVTVEPMRAFPPVRDLVTDVSVNFRMKKTIRKFQPRAPDFPDGTWRMYQADVDRVQEFRKCIECFLCQDVCHVLRDHNKHAEFIGPRFLVYAANLEMNPLDAVDRMADLKNEHGIGYCNITKCCTRTPPPPADLGRVLPFGVPGPAMLVVSAKGEAMTPKQVSEMMDAIAGVAEAVLGFRQKLIDGGVPADVADEMALAFVQMIANQGGS